MNYKPIDWSKPVQTKDGQKVHIFCTDAKLPQLPQPVVGHIEGTNYVTTWDLDGHWTSHDSKNDLINVPLQSKYRPWRQDEVPVGALFKVLYGYGTPQVILGASDEGVYFINSIGKVDLYYYNSLLANDRIYSTDQGKTWQPCGILE